jgi:hypothetical protein
VGLALEDTTVQSFRRASGTLRCDLLVYFTDLRVRLTSGMSGQHCQIIDSGDRVKMLSRCHLEARGWRA